MSDVRYIYDLHEGDASMKPLLGGKGAGVAEMFKVGVPVPDQGAVMHSAFLSSREKKCKMNKQY